MKDDELDLWRRYRKGDQTAFGELLGYKSYMSLLRFWVRQVVSAVPWADYHDLMHDGLAGMADAIQGFDPDKGNEFSTYAGYFIRGALFESLQQSRNLTRHLFENYSKINQAQAELMRLFERQPTLEEIAEKAGLSPEQVERTLNAMSIAFPAEFITSDADPPEGAVTVESPETIILIRELSLKLNEREREVLYEFYEMGRTDREIGELLSLKADHAKKIRHRALAKLKRFIELNPGGEHNGN